MIAPSPIAVPYAALPWYTRAGYLLGDYALLICVAPFYFGHCAWRWVRSCADSHYVYPDEETDDTNV